MLVIARILGIGHVSVPNFLPVISFYILSFLLVTNFQLPTIFRNTHFAPYLLHSQMCHLCHNDQKNELNNILEVSFWGKGPFNQSNPDIEFPEMEPFLGYKKCSGSMYLGQKKWRYSAFLGYNYCENFTLFLHGL